MMSKSFVVIGIVLVIVTIVIIVRDIHSLQTSSSSRTATNSLASSLASNDIVCTNNIITLFTKDQIASLTNNDNNSNNNINNSTSTTSTTTSYSIVSKKSQPFTVIDIIIFYNEIDILLIRLHELNNIVDKFIIIEGSNHSYYSISTITNIAS